MKTVASQIRSLANVMAMQEVDASVIDWLKNLAKSLEEGLENTEERIRIQQYLNKHPDIMKPLKELETVVKG